MNEFYCRFCAEKQPSTEKIDLDEDLNRRLEVMDKLSLFIINFVDFSDRSLPNTICKVCYCSLNLAHDFFTKIKLSQIVLTHKNFDDCKTEIVNKFDADESHHNCMELESCFETELQVPYSNGINNMQATNTNDRLMELGNEKHKLKLRNFDDIPVSDEGEADNNLLPKKYEVDDIPLSDHYKDDYTASKTSTANESWDTYPWVCKYCNEKIDSMETLRKHSKEYHNTCYSFKCVDCKKSTHKFHVFVSHVRRHRVKLNHYCQYCNLKLEPNQSSKHLSTHISQPHCIACGEIFLNNAALKHHILCYQQDSKPCRSTRSSKQKSLQELCKQSVMAYIDEVRKETWKDYPWICQYCNMQFPGHDVLRKHVKEYHGKCFGLSCGDCTTKVYDFKEFVEHVRCHRPNLKYYCQYCDSKFDSPTNSIIHITEHLIKQLQCDSCGELFQCDSDLHSHLKEYGPIRRATFKKRGAPITIQDLTCNICHKIAKNLNILRTHKKMHMNRNRDHTCDRCGKAFFTKGALDAHFLIHEPPAPEICEICKKSFLTLTRLKKHVKSHYADKPFQCNECKRTFRLKDQLKSHMIRHTNEAPFKCQHCEKVFKYRNVLKTHVNQHTGARPYNCEKCFMSFSNWSNCNKHMKRKHSMTIAKNIRTPQGLAPINPETGKPKKLEDIEVAKDWTQKILVPRKRGKKFPNLQA